MQRKKKNASNFSKEDEEGEKRQRLEDEEGGVRAVASVENVPNSGAFWEHIICKHNKFKFYIPVNVVIRELVGGIEKTHGGE